ncbi:hypothetical protein HY837_02765 [archaeon]|nr:hypothetical protein [archaeon]
MNQENNVSRNYQSKIGLALSLFAGGVAAGVFAGYCIFAPIQVSEPDVNADGRKDLVIKSSGKDLSTGLSLASNEFTFVRQENGELVLSKINGREQNQGGK